MITFVGSPRGEHIYVDVFLGDEKREKVSLEPLMLSLDQWHYLRKLSDLEGSEEEHDPLLWATTPEDYESSIGEPLYT